MNYSKFLTRVSAARQPSAIRSLQPLTLIPGMISLGGGLPNPGTFPFSKIEVSLNTGEGPLCIDGAELKAALQYAPTEGLPSFVEWVNSYIRKFHRPQIKDWSICVSTGSQDALSKAFEMILEAGDVIFVDIPTYPGALSALRPLGCDIVGVETDGDGMICHDLEGKMRQEKNGGKTLKAIYTTPIGQNPRGSSLTRARKQRILELAREFDVLILEDDPYYFLQLDTAADADHLFPLRQYAPTLAIPAESFFSMDVDGRVMRFDSLSKVLSAGMRIGWTTGPKDLVERINLHMQANSLHACALSQAVCAALLARWGDEGLARHVERIQQFYRTQRDHLIQSIHKHLISKKDGTSLVEFDVPHAGMFIWMELKNVRDTNALIMKEAREKKVLMVPGTPFLPVENTPSKCVRAAFSVASPADMDEAIRRLSECLDEYS